MPVILEKIADFKSRELILLASVIFCLFFAYIFRELGFSFALGSFIAGILLSSSSVNHGIFAEVRPLRDLFSTVFFVSLGFMITPSFILSSWQLILLMTIFILIIKFLISSILVFVLGFHSKTATFVGVSLVSVGEFAFILSLMGLNSNLISRDIYMLILSVTFLTLVISIPLYSISEKFYYTVKRFVMKNIPYAANFLNRLERMKMTDSDDLKDHVVVLGHGRVGKYISRALGLADIPFVVVDYNHHLVKYLRHEGIRVIYGDPVEIDVLRFAKVESAKAVVLAYADRNTQEMVVANAFTINPSIRLICRTHFEEDQKRLISMGAQVVIQPEFEAALSMITNILDLFGENKGEIDNKIKSIRKEHRWF